MEWAEVSLEPAGSPLPLTQNNLHTTESHLGVIHSEPLQYQTRYGQTILTEFGSWWLLVTFKNFFNEEVLIKAKNQ